MTSEPLKFTDAAIKYLTKMLQENKVAHFIKVSVKTAGCSGLKYVLECVTASAADDETQKISEDLTVLIDKKALPYIMGSTVDYVKEGLNSKIKFTNPNEKNSCGCGESFYI
jgi:iron-sulfur cluster assembly accessory protein